MKYYVVKNGRIPGIYNTWTDCNSQINGFPKSIYKSFQNYQDALNYFSVNVDEKTIVHEKQPIRQIFSDDSYEVTRTIYVDGAYNKNTKPNSYGSVVNNQGLDMIIYNKNLLTDMLIENKDLPVGNRDVIICNFTGVSQQNNAAELMAMIAGLRIAINYINNGILVKHIASDSKLIIEYWSKYIKKETEELSDPKKVFYIKELILLRKRFESLGGSIVKVESDTNPADLGWHVVK
uniref:Ribonuclease H n=1 Tax=viral metagenome TaxID=1070528 RepID=A0A6C0BET8_9ZZZZ